VRGDIGGTQKAADAANTMDVDRAEEKDPAGGGDEYKLSAVLSGMNEPVRVVEAVGNNLIISAGTKGKVMAWRRAEDKKSFKGTVHRSSRIFWLRLSGI